MTGSKTQASNTIWLAISFLAVAALGSFAFAWHLAKDRCVVALTWLANGVAHKLMNFTKSLAAPPAPSELSSRNPIKDHHFLILTTISCERVFQRSALLYGYPGISTGAIANSFATMSLGRLFPAHTTFSDNNS